MESERTQDFSKSLGTFSRNLYQRLIKVNPNSNLICSPFSIQTCAGMLRMGAEDNSATAKELDEGLSFNSNYVKEIANGFSNVLASYEQCSALKMAHKLYLMKDYQASEEFQDILTQKFHSETENIDFTASADAANTINAWIESKTNRLITNLVGPDALNADTRLVLINAVYFKGQWTVKFEEELNAKALRLPYRDTDLSMLIVLPNSIGGLQQLEKKLQTIPLEDITSKLDSMKVNVKLPKFKAEFEQELTQVFKDLGINRIFTGEGNFEKMLVSNESVGVSNIFHKAFIEVSEEGTEAGAATGAAIRLKTLSSFEIKPEMFHANHPFYYTIYSAKHGCLFVGNLNVPDVTDFVEDEKLICLCSGEPASDDELSNSNINK